MRPGPSTEALAAAVGQGARLTSFRGAQVLYRGLPASSVTVEADVDRVMSTRLQFTVPTDLEPDGPGGAVANWGQRIFVESLLELDGDRIAIPYGWYLIQEPEGEDDGIAVTAHDLTQIIVDNPNPWPSSPPAGATVYSEARRLVESTRIGMGLPMIAEFRDRSIPRTTQWGVDRLEALRDLCESYGLAYGVKPDGYLHIWEQPAKAQPTAFYSEANLLVSATSKARERIPNRWIVAGSPQGDDSVKWTSVIENFGGDYAPNLYGVITDRREFNAATSADAVRKAAETYQAKALAEKGVRSIEIPFDPRLELHDDIRARVSRPDGGVEYITGRVTALAASLDAPDQTMRVDVKELYW